MYTKNQIATLFGVNISSIERWIETGKIQYGENKDGTKYFTTDHLSEFSLKYNISIKFPAETIYPDHRAADLYSGNIQQIINSKH